MAGYSIIAPPDPYFVFFFLFPLALPNNFLNSNIRVWCDQIYPAISLKTCTVISHSKQNSQTSMQTKQQLPHNQISPRTQEQLSQDCNTCTNQISQRTQQKLSLHKQRRKTWTTELGPMHLSHCHHGRMRSRHFYRGSPSDEIAWRRRATSLNPQATSRIVCRSLSSKRNNDNNDDDDDANNNHHRHNNNKHSWFESKKERPDDALYWLRASQGTTKDAWTRNRHYNNFKQWKI